MLRGWILSLAALPLVSITPACQAYDRGQYDALIDDAPDTVAADASSPMDVSPSDDVAIDAADATDTTSSDSCAPIPPHDLCGSIPALATTPTIDGVLECGLSLTRIAPMGWSGSDPAPADVAASYAIAWRPEGLYFFVHVLDPRRVTAPDPAQLWCGDAVELFVDSDGTFSASPEFDTVGTYQFIVAAPADAAHPSAHATINGGPDRHTTRQLVSSDFGGFPTADGYNVEAFVQAHDLELTTWTLMSGASIGFDISIDVGVRSGTDGGACPRDGQFTLQLGSGTCPQPVCTVAAFCTPRLD